MSPRPEDLILAACCTLELNARQRDQLAIARKCNAIDWQLVLNAAITHKVAPLVYQNLRHSEPLIGKIPEALADQFRDVARHAGIRNFIVTSGIAQVAGYFDAHLHDLLILKHTAYWFIHPPLFELTMSDDVDLVARPRSEASRSETLDNNSSPYLWSSNGTPDHTWEVIDGLIASKNPRTRLLNLEIDNRLHHDVVWNGVIPIDFRRIWADATPFPADGQIVFVPRIDDMIIITAINVFRKPFLRLRNLVEIRELIQLNKSFDWDALTRKARAYQCGSLVYSALSATEAILGDALSDSDLNGLKPGLLRSRAIVRINRRICPTAIYGDKSVNDGERKSRRSLLDLARRMLALDLRQLGRFLWFRIMLRRVARVIRH